MLCLGAGDSQCTPQRDLIVKHRTPQSDGFAVVAVLVAGLAMALGSKPCAAGPASGLLPLSSFRDAHAGAQPVNNAAFAPGRDALPAPAFLGVVSWTQSPMATLPQLQSPVVGGRDARLLPAVRIEFFTEGDNLVPVERGQMLAETGTVATPSYWRVIPQPGKVWREPGEGSWSRAAFAIMIVNDTENDAHQGLATFLYRGDEVSDVRFQFVQHTAPYLLHQHFVASGIAHVTASRGDAGKVAARRSEFNAELAERLPARPWSALEQGYPKGALDGFGGPVVPKWRVTVALVRENTLYYQEAPTDYGNYPYTLEMRFGVRSIMKSVAAPLSLLHLAQVYGPYVLNLRVGDYVRGLPAKFERIRFIDLANMASGFGGTGSLRTHPNDGFDGYLDGDYDGWYTAPSNAEKLQRIAAMRPYPWEPGTVWRYRDQDFYLLGVAIDAFVKSVRGADADAWDMLRQEVFAPIGIRYAPTVRTREANGRDGVAWFNAGYYPTLDDLAKIALLYQQRGAHNGQQLLHRQLTEDLLAARNAVNKTADASATWRDGGAAAAPSEWYRMGFHFTPFTGSRSRALVYLPTMSGSGDNEVMLFPNGMISIRIAKAAELPAGEKAQAGDPLATPHVVDRLMPF